MNEKEYFRELSKVSGSRLNVIIKAVNLGTPKNKVSFKSEVEEMFYDRLVKQAEEHKKKYGERPVFDNVEIESDDPVLDIYNN